MKRLLVLLALAVLVGCQQPVASERVAEPTAPMAQAPPPSPSAEIDFANWPTATDKPYRVDPVVAVACAPWTYRIRSRRPSGSVTARTTRNRRPHPPRSSRRSRRQRAAVGQPSSRRSTPFTWRRTARRYGAMVNASQLRPRGDWGASTSTQPRNGDADRIESCIDCHAREGQGLPLRATCQENGRCVGMVGGAAVGPSGEPLTVVACHAEEGTSMLDKCRRCERSTAPTPATRHR